MYYIVYSFIWSYTVDFTIATQRRYSHEFWLCRTQKIVDLFTYVMHVPHIQVSRICGALCGTYMD